MDAAAAEGVQSAGKTIVAHKHDFVNAGVTSGSSASRWAFVGDGGHAYGIPPYYHSRNGPKVAAFPRTGN